jgi:hypothetical protein
VAGSAGFNLISPSFPLPTALGTYSYESEGTFDDSSGTRTITDTAAELTITNVPEPTSIELFVASVAALTLRARKKRAGTRPSLAS